MELQKGNLLAAVLLLVSAEQSAVKLQARWVADSPVLSLTQERSVQYDPKNQPVLHWRAVQLAQQAVLSKRKKMSMMTNPLDSQIAL